MSIFYECKQIIDANLDFFLFLMQMPFIEMQMQNIHMMHMFSFQRCNSWCKCLMQGCRCKVYSWWRQRTYLIVMQMSSCRDVDIKCLVVQMPFNGYVMMQMLLVGMPWCQCPLVGMPWCKCPLVGMPWCKCILSACHDANVRLVICNDANAHCGYAMMWMSAWEHAMMPWCECSLGSIP